MKSLLQSSPTLGIPDPTKPLIQAVDERRGCMTSVLLQCHYSAQAAELVALTEACKLASVKVVKFTLTAATPLVLYTTLVLCCDVGKFRNLRANLC